MGKGYKIVSVLSCSFFIVMVIVAINTPKFPRDVLQIKVVGDFEMTSISMAAVIMILYNLFTWVEITQNLRNGKRFIDCKSEMEKAQHLISQLDEICTTCSTIKNSIVQ